VICEHLLKWQYQPEQRSRSWSGSVIEARNQIADLIEESPSLAAYTETRLAGARGAYARGREKAARNSGIMDLPETCSWSIEQLLDPNFWPE
jgi:hypothetical protein